MNAFGSAMSIAPRVDDGQTTRARHRPRCLNFLAFQRLSVFAWHDSDEFPQCNLSLREHAPGPTTSRQPRVPLHQMPHQITLPKIEQRDEVDHPGIALLRELIELVE